MGGGASAESNSFTNRLAMPPYYLDDAFLDDKEMSSLRDTWKLILDDRAPGYLKAKADGAHPEGHSGVVFFYESFYQRLFDVHPSAKVLFENSLTKMGPMLVGMLSSCVTMISNISEMAPKLESLAKMHARKGVVAWQYGIVGEVLFWALAHSLDEELYKTVSVTWIKVYSILLKVMMPIAIEAECVKYNNAD